MTRSSDRYTSNTGNSNLECPLLGVKPTKFAAIRTWKFGQDRAIPAPDAFGCLPTKADEAQLVCEGAVMTHNCYSISMDSPIGSA